MQINCAVRFRRAFVVSWLCLLLRSGIGLSQNQPEHPDVPSYVVIPPDTVILFGPSDELDELEIKFEQVAAAQFSEPFQEVIQGRRLLKVYVLQHASATAMASQIQEIMKSDASVDDQEIVPLIQPMEHAGRLVVSCTVEDHIVINDLVRWLDLPSSVKDRMRVFELSYLDPSDVAEQVAAMIELEHDRAEAGIAPVMIESIGQDRLAVRGTRQQLADVEHFITLIDRPSLDKARSLDVMQLEHVQASDVVTALETILKDEDNGLLPLTGDGADLVLGKDVVLEAYEPTNAVMIKAPREVIDEIRALVTQLDAVQLQQSEIMVLPLTKHDKPAEVVKILEDVFSMKQPGASDDEEAIILSGDEAGTMTFTADEVSNSIVAVGPASSLALVRDVIAQIDADQPQVLIEFMVIEVQIDDGFQLGIEFATQDLLFSEKATTGPNGTVQGPEFDFVAGTDLGAVGTGGFSFTMSGEDFNFLFNALQSTGRADLISRPSIVVGDNVEDANLFFGSNVPTLSAQGSDNQGNATTQVTYVDAGVQLQAVPQIDPGGFIQLDVTASVDSVGPQINVGNVSSVSINKASLATTVTIPDGHTVIIGGLVQGESVQSESRVPWLGDLPGIGALFRSTTDTSSRREIIVVITATIIDSVQNISRVTTTIRDGMSEIPQVEPLSSDGLAE